jgi:diaminopimelate epimerase
MIQFTKMHGTGNDYIYIDDRKGIVKNPGKLARAMSDRNFGVGSDGLILIMGSKQADYRMRMFNADGSEAEMCGNGIRCFAKYLYDRGIARDKKMTVETLAGIKKLSLNTARDRVSSVKVDMGEPILARDRIPMIGDTGMVINETLPLDDGARFVITSLSMGNPHVVVFVEDVENFPVLKYGPMIECHHLFPQRTNVEFVQVVNNHEIIQRTWERGAGETLSCGTGASAATVACILNNLTGRSLSVQLRGGRLNIQWREKDNHVYLAGPAVEVFSGTWPE